MSSAEGEDRSSYQAVTSWAGLDFGFCKATNGLGLIDPTFAANWANLASEGKVRGAYHELTATSSATAQANFFVATVRARGLRQLDMLAVVASDYAGVTAADVKAFCDTVVRLVGPHNPVLIYTDLSVGQGLGICTSYELWVSWPEDTPPRSVAPWSTWHFWQWSWTPVDKDAFNGDTAALHSWLNRYRPKPPPPKPAPSLGEEDDMPTATLTEGGAALTVPVPAGAKDLVLTGDPTVVEGGAAAQLRIGSKAPWKEQTKTLDWDSSPLRIPVDGASVFTVSVTGGGPVLLTASFA